MDRKFRLEDRALEDAIATREQFRLCVEKDEEFFSGVRVDCIENLLKKKEVELSKINSVNKTFICDLAKDLKIKLSVELRDPLGTPWKHVPEWDKATHIIKLIQHIKYLKLPSIKELIEEELKGRQVKKKEYEAIKQSKKEELKAMKEALVQFFRQRFLIQFRGTNHIREFLCQKFSFFCVRARDHFTHFVKKYMYVFCDFFGVFF